MFASKVKAAAQAIALPVVVITAAGVFASPALGAEWAVGKWTECSAPCGGGIQTREFGCVDEIGRVVSDDACDGLSRPAERQECNTEPCPDLCGSDTDCPAHLYCAKAPGDCHGEGVCREHPLGCSRIFKPVCGCDGFTYSNDCVAASNGVNVAFEGHCDRVCGGIAGIGCPDGEFCQTNVGECCCDFQGVCTPLPRPCTDEFAPVCGCDGNIYGNACEAAAAGVSIDNDGACFPPRCETDQDCEALRGWCIKPPGQCDGPGTCSNGGGGCFLEPTPVCGCDGITYDSPCAALHARVNIAHEGACEKVCGGILGIGCPDGEFCQTNVGECCCDFQGVCTPLPDACPEIRDPVCGCDGVTYDNECLARAHGVSIDHEGECAPRACEHNEHCADGAYCRKELGNCDGVGVCHERPLGCPDNVDPVCGCDGQTYFNPCDAAMAGVSIAHEGECVTRCEHNEHCAAGTYCRKELADCDGVGLCHQRPPVCTEEFAPVCGCDGVTYDNECLARAAGVSIDHEGECERVCGTILGLSCEDGEYCRFPIGHCDFADDAGVCETIPTGCPDHVDPVCGCDGITYGNPCEAAAVGMNIDHKGPCHLDACAFNEQCPRGTYCAKEFGDCNGVGQCLEQPPGDCPLVFDPVCGCDGKTYSNVCFARAAGVNLAHEGECAPAPRACEHDEHCADGAYCRKELGNCNGVGVCHERPPGCTDNVDPVCGCDGHTYFNPCDAAMAGVSLAHEGACKTVLCEHNEHCPGDTYCAKELGGCDGVGTCRERPDACTREFNPVCGCDGNTYGNACTAAAAGVSIAHEGHCATECVAGTPCDDGDPCTFEDRCIEGECVGTPASRADLDCDGDVDLSDYVTMQAAYTGAGGHATISGVDMDGDGDSDLADILIFQTEFTGPR